MKVLLLAPPAAKYLKDYKEFAPPVGLLWIGSALKERGHEVRIVDCLGQGLHVQSSRKDERGELIRYGLSNEHIEKEIANFAPDVVGVSSLFTSQHCSAVQTCRIVKKVNPNIVTVVGGGHASFVWDEILRSCPDIDFVIRGEGEYALSDLLEHVEDNTFEQVPGLAYRTHDGLRSNPVARIPNLNDLPLPDLSVLDLSAYSKANSRYYCYGSSVGERWLSFHSSRGCQFSCEFCLSERMEGTHIRQLSLANFETYVAKLCGAGVSDVQIEDNNFLLQANWKEKVQIFRSYDLKYNLINGVSPHLLNKEAIRTLADTGCYRVFYPIESANGSILEGVGKTQAAGIGFQEHLKTIGRLGDFSIDIIAAYMIGLPGETIDDMRRTTRLAESVFQACPGKVQTYVFHVTPLPGTRLYERCVRENLLIDDWDRDTSFNWTYRFPHIVTRCEYRHDIESYIREVAGIADNAIGRANRPEIAGWIVRGSSWHS